MYIFGCKIEFDTVNHELTFQKKIYIAYEVLCLVCWNHIYKTGNKTHNIIKTLR